MSGRARSKGQGWVLSHPGVDDQVGRLPSSEGMGPGAPWLHPPQHKPGQQGQRGPVMLPSGRRGQGESGEEGFHTSHFFRHIPGGLTSSKGFLMLQECPAPPHHP